MPTVNSFGTRTVLQVGDQRVHIYSLPALQIGGYPEISRLPYSMKILLENLLRHEDGRFVKASDVETCRTSRAFRPWSISLRCATASCVSAATRTGSTRCSPSSW